MDMSNTSATASAPLGLDPQSPGTRLNAWFDPQTPWQSGFMSVLRAIAARAPTMPLPGTARLPSEEPFRIGDITLCAFASLGLAYGDETTSASDLLRNADLAMYEAKRDSGSRRAQYQPGLHMAALRGMDKVWSSAQGCTHGMVPASIWRTILSVIS